MSMAELLERFPGVEVIENTELLYAEAGKGPWKLYIYGQDGYHSGAQWFTADRIKYPKEEITVAKAKERSDAAVAAGREVRICDGGDNLVFHSENGKVVYGETFWNEIQPDPAASAVAKRLKGRK